MSMKTSTEDKRRCKLEWMVCRTSRFPVMNSKILQTWGIHNGSSSECNLRDHHGQKWQRKAESDTAVSLVDDFFDHILGKLTCPVRTNDR